MIISHFSFDTREIIFPKKTGFLALSTGTRDGHLFINRAIEKGVVLIICEKIDWVVHQPSIAFIQVTDTIKAYQTIASFHRSRFDIPIVGITGSNGKTTIKEWISQGLQYRYKVVKTPKSYNSQIGVPHSILQINENHDIGVFETGISRSNEMLKLQSVIKPTIGIFTNIGQSHSEGFESKEQKIREKLSLFNSCENIIYCQDQCDVANLVMILFPKKNKINWGKTDKCYYQVSKVNIDKRSTEVRLKTKRQSFSFFLPFVEDSLVENGIHTIVLLLTLEVEKDDIQHMLNGIFKRPIRMEKLEGKDHCIVINDSYSSDLNSFEVAINYFNNQSGSRKKVILTNGVSNLEDQEKLLALFDYSQMDEILWIGDLPMHDVSIKISHFKDIEQCVSYIEKQNFNNQAILVKGTRKVALERILPYLIKKTHNAQLEINLGAIGRNIYTFGTKLKTDTKIMAVIKAGAYGSGAYEMAKYLESKGLDYLAVAYFDEAIELRHLGITMPILVFNFYNVEDIISAIKYNIDIQVASLHQLNSMVSYLSVQELAVQIHLKIETGMHRQGIEFEEINQVIDIIKSEKTLNVKSVFSHLASSENPNHDDFNRNQYERLIKAKQLITASLGEIDVHLLNSEGILRLPEYQFDMVRLGIGMYGISKSMEKNILEATHVLKASIIQIKEVAKGEGLGYNRSEVVENDRKIAILNIGYADGVPRLAGNRNWHVYLKEEKVPIVGNVCMDLVMIDITDLPEAEIGDSVEVFGANVKLQDLAKACQTIPYEILSNISPRIRRAYIND